MLIGPHYLNLCLSGILADEMGLGKTLQSISILAYMRDFQKVRCEKDAACKSLWTNEEVVALGCLLRTWRVGLVTMALT